MLDHILFLPPMAHLLRHFILRTRHLHDIQQYISFECLDEIVNCFIGPTFHTMTQSWHANMKKFWISTFFALKFVNHNSSFILSKKKEKQLPSISSRRTLLSYQASYSTFPFREHHSQLTDNKVWSREQERTSQEVRTRAVSTVTTQWHSDVMSHLWT